MSFSLFKAFDTSANIDYLGLTLAIYPIFGLSKQYFSLYIVSISFLNVCKLMVIFSLFDKYENNEQCQVRVTFKNSFFIIISTKKKKIFFFSMNLKIIIFVRKSDNVF